jgi:Cupredoxin-like domain
VGLGLAPGFHCCPLGAVLSLPVRAADMEVNVDNFTFTPKELTVKEGTTIVFRNRDDIPHGVIGAKGEFHCKALDTGDSFSFTFAKVGSYRFFLRPASANARQDSGHAVKREGSSSPRGHCGPGGVVTLLK